MTEQSTKYTGFKQLIQLNGREITFAIKKRRRVVEVERTTDEFNEVNLGC